jgi:hypothetical protein
LIALSALLDQSAFNGLSFPDHIGVLAIGERCLRCELRILVHQVFEMPLGPVLTHERCLFDGTMHLDCGESAREDSRKEWCVSSGGGSSGQQELGTAKEARGSLQLVQRPFGGSVESCSNMQYHKV